MEIPEPQPLTISTKDLATLKITYYPGLFGKKSIPIIMVHDWRGQRTEFDAPHQVVIRVLAMGQGQAVTALMGGCARCWMPGGMFGRLQNGRVAHLDVVVTPKVPVQARASLQYRHEPDVHDLLQGRVIRHNLHDERDPGLGQPDMVDLVQDILELLWTAVAFSEMDTERDAIDGVQS